MVADGETGLIVPPTDADALAGALSALAADPARRAAMGAKGCERVEALFTLNGMVDRIEGLVLRGTAQKARSEVAFSQPAPASSPLTCLQSAMVEMFSDDCPKRTEIPSAPLVC